jgi:hypothetical protein
MIGLPADAVLRHLKDVVRVQPVLEDDTIVVGSWRMSFWLPDGIVESILIGE